MEYGSIIIWAAIIVGAYMAWNIGANDVANAMGTSVGSKAISLRAAVWVAACCNFLGAWLVGPSVSATVRGRIVDPAIFAETMDIFVIGMLAALLASAIWLNIATYFGWPVSTTHAIVGAIVGFGVSTHGLKAVDWMVMLKIVASWLISPISGAIMASLIFYVIIRTIFFAPKPIQAAKIWIPWIVAGTIFVLIISLFLKGLSNFNLIQSADNPDAPLPAGSNYVIALILALFGFIMSKIWMGNIKHTDLNTSRTQKFKVVEKIFAKLQIASACYVAFAHGSNDVANAIGPVAAVVSAVQEGAIRPDSVIPMWLLIGGGASIAAGIIIWGWRVIKTIGEKITGITPSRGFAAEFGTATTVLICSQLGLPISTTHTLVGAVIGVGFARGMRALNLSIIKRIVITWLYTIPFTAVLTIIIFYIIRALFL